MTSVLEIQKKGLTKFRTTKRQIFALNIAFLWHFHLCWSVFRQREGQQFCLVYAREVATTCKGVNLSAFLSRNIFKWNDCFHECVKVSQTRFKYLTSLLMRFAKKRVLRGRENKVRKKPGVAGSLKPTKSHSCQNGVLVFRCQQTSPSSMTTGLKSIQSVLPKWTWFYGISWSHKHGILWDEIRTLLLEKRW